MSETLSIFTAPEGEKAYLAAYEEMFHLWPVSHEEIDVETRFGRTHINAAGPQEAPPMVLLHAASFSSTAWFANIGALSRYHRVFALDIIGDAGRSVITRRLQNWQDHARWLDDVFSGLGIEQAALVGHSQGGWMALAMALAYPQRVKRLVLLAPAASIHPFAWYVKLGLNLARRMIRADARSQLKMAAAKGAVLQDRFVQLMEIVTQYCLPVTMVPATYSDDQLESVAMPTLLLIGTQEKIYNPKRAMRRAQRLIPDVTTAFIPQSSHLLIMEQPDLVNSKLLGFLARGMVASPLGGRSGAPR